MIRGSSGALACAALALACAPDRAPAPAPAARPNVLLISLDSTRRDHLGCYGRRPEHAPQRSPSPRVDALAREGVRFDDALATSCWTLPSHMSLFTGQPLEVHAIERDDQCLAPQLPTLAELLARGGYRTAGFASGPYLSPRHGFARGFQTYRLCYGPALANAHARLEKLLAAQPAASRGILAAAEREVDALTHLDASSASVSDAAIEALRGAHAAGAPFFVFAHYFDPHYDYVAPEALVREFDPDYAGAQDGRGLLTRADISTPLRSADPPGRRERTCSDRDLEHLLARYDADIAATDAEVGRVLDELERLGLARDTLVVVTADHGDEFFEHQGLGHRRTLYDEVLRVPLIVRWPARLAGGTSVPELVSLTDVLPSLLEWLDLPTPVTPLGASFAALAEGRAGPEPPRSAQARYVRHMKVRPPLEAPLEAEDRAHLERRETIEAYCVGPLKLLRERLDSVALPSASPATRARAAAVTPRETLAWIDRTAHPSEPPAAWSTDFSAAAPAAALEAWRARYELARGRRIAALAAAGDANSRRGLAALGYLEDSAAESIDGGNALPPTPSAAR